MTRVIALMALAALGLSETPVQGPVHGRRHYSTGCAHAPHHVARAWTDKYKGKFDGGWDKLREQTFERQKRLGIIPQDTERPDLFPAWDSLNDADRGMPGTP